MRRSGKVFAALVPEWNDSEVYKWAAVTGAGWILWMERCSSASSLVSSCVGCTVTSFTKGMDTVLPNDSLEVFMKSESHHFSTSWCWGQGRALREKKHIGCSDKAAAVVTHKVAWQVEVHVKCAPGEKEEEEEEEEGRLNLCQSTKAKGAWK